MIRFLSKVNVILRLMRIRQWVKNSFVLAPLIFSGQFGSLQSVTYSFLAVFFFCIASSATYVLNDLKDLNADALHPTKSKSRPLASGELTVSFGISLLILLYAILVFGWFVIPGVLNIIALYLILNLAYTLFLKHQPIIDIFVIALGFVLRVYAGTKSLDIEMSSWIFITTLSLALYLGAVKRRQELILVGSASRKVLNKYSIQLVERYAEMSATCAIVFYSMYVMADKPNMVITIPFVLYGLFRYWYVVDHMSGGESPTDVLLQDNQLKFTLISWVLACIYTIN